MALGRSKGYAEGLAGLAASAAEGAAGAAGAAPNVNGLSIPLGALTAGVPNVNPLLVEAAGAGVIVRGASVSTVHPHSSRQARRRKGKAAQPPGSKEEQRHRRPESQRKQT